MKNELFIGALIDQVGEMNEMRSPNFRFENYKVEIIEGEKFIKGSGEAELLTGNRELEFDEVHLLMSMINLVKGDLPSRYFHPDPTRNGLDEVISDDDVLNWVKKYGIPYKDIQLNEVLGDGKLRIDCVHIQLFKFKIAALYARFSIWEAVTNEDLQKAEKYLMSLLTFNHRKQNEPDSDELTVIRQCLAQEVGIEANVKMRLEYNLEKKKNVFILTSDSLLNIAYYQLAALMTKPYTESKKKMKTCVSCDSLFWANHARTKYCPNCDRRTVWSRKKRKEEHGS